jgi:two-component system CheB/CheR fusion protein
MIAAERDFDAILSDISMPGMDGFEFLGRLRKFSGKEKIPVMALTGFGRSEDIERARAAGFFAHFTKPLDIEKLAETLARVSTDKHRDHHNSSNGH